MINNYYLKIVFIINIFFLILIFENAYSSNKVVILVKIDKEIVTNIDIENEARYLLALNPGLRSVKKEKLIIIAKQSIIKEKIKKIEISKYYKLEAENEYFDRVFKDFYNGLNINNEADFEKYLSNYELNISEVKGKLKIETLWNELIYTKFQNQIEIDEIKLKNNLKKKLSNKKEQKSYLIYEIIFSAENKEELKKKHEIIKNSIKEIGFQNTANIYSESDTSKKNGKIGWINENQLSNLIKKELSIINIGEYSNLISVTGGSLILKKEDTKIIKNNLNFEDEFQKSLSFERNRQLNQFSTIYFNKIKNNINIYEK